jgi:hypothetical protein
MDGADEPLVRMEFRTEEGDRHDLMNILIGYAKQEGFSLENIGPNMPQRDKRPVLYVIPTRDDSAEITVTNFLKQDQMLLYHYRRNTAHPEQIIDALISEIRVKWPDIHPYLGL